MRRTIYDVTLEELEFLRHWSTEGKVPSRLVKKLFNNFISKVNYYEKKNGDVLETLYFEDYREIYDQIAITKDEEKMIDIITDHPWEEKNFAIVLGTQMFHVWCDTLLDMTHESMRATFGALVTYLQAGVGPELLMREPTKKHGINIGQALCWANSMAVVETAIQVALAKKEKGGV